MINSTTLVNSSAVSTNANKNNFTNLTATGSTNEFASMLEQMTYNNSSQLETIVSKTTNDSKKTIPQNNLEKVDNSKNDTTLTQTDSQLSKPVEEKLDVASEISEAEIEIKQVLMEKLNVTEEELAAAMENLGLSFIDCLDSSNLANLMVELSGSDDVSMILTDETLFMTFTEVSESVGEISEALLSELGVTKEEFATIVANLKEQLANNDSATTEVADEAVPDDKGKITENLKPSDGKEVINETPVSNTTKDEATDDVTVAKTSDNKKEYQSSLDKQYDGADDLTKRETTSEKVETVVEDSNDKQSPVQTFAERMEATATKASATTSNTQQTVSPQEIFNQINSQIKLAMNGDETKMQFQLNPEFLGKVTVQVAVKAGVVTAQFAAENQTVKEAIEGQIVQLKESLNNQGLKVEAVEVTIESHEFERNLEENEHNRENLEEKKQSGRKQLNYREIEDLEELPEDEALIAEMMVGSGNSINYTA